MCTIYGALMLIMLFCCKICSFCNLRCFVAKSVLSRFTRYRVEKICAKNCACGEKRTNIMYVSRTLPVNCPLSKFSWSFVIHVIFSLLCEACYEKPWLHLPTSGTPPTYKLNPPPSLLSLKNIHFIIWEIQFEKREIWFKQIHLPTSRIPVTYSSSSFFM